MNRKRSGLHLHFALLAVVLLVAATAFAQSTATLQGTVTDESGAVVPNARVTAVNQETNLQRSTVTDTTGNYLIPTLPVGTYRVEVETSGMQRQLVRE
ncbi:MAG: carboxypeptidase-like regulatory domain-containing protein, partial [Terriglobales bacterium]